MNQYEEVLQHKTDEAARILNAVEEAKFTFDALRVQDWPAPKFPYLSSIFEHARFSCQFEDIEDVKRVLAMLPTDVVVAKTFSEYQGGVAVQFTYGEVKFELFCSLVGKCEMTKHEETTLTLPLPEPEPYKSTRYELVGTCLNSLLGDVAGA